MARSIFFLAFLTCLLLIIALWIIKARFNGKHSFFSLDLPERPQKAIKSRFRERTKEKIHTFNANVRHQRQGGSFTSATFPPSSIAGDVIGAHVHTRNTPASTSLEATIENITSLPIHGVATKAASYLKLSKSGTGKDRAPLEIVGEDSSSVFSAQTMQESTPATIKRKPVATGQNTSQHDSLIERFERLRLPSKTTSHSCPAPPLLSPQHPASISFPQMQMSQSFWDKMATPSQAQSSVTAPSFSPNAQQGIIYGPQRPPQAERRFEHTTMAEAQNNESVDTSESTEPDINPYRQRIPARKRTLSSLRRRDVQTVRSRRRRTRSPSVSSRASEVNMTPVSSQEVSYPDLSNVVAEEQAESSSSSEHDKSRFLDSTDASLLQIELDRQLAQRLQQEEEDENNAAELLWAQLMDAAHHLPLQRPGGSAGWGRSGPDAFNQTGSRDDPISLDSDSDSNSEDFDEVIFAGRNRIRKDQVDSEDTMLLDDDSSGWESCDNFDDAQTAVDANLARMLQDEENHNQSTTHSTRECAVCGEQQPISELPSLADCEHAPQTCAECYADWITAQLEESSWKEAKCPEGKCKTTLTYHEIQGIATQDTFQKYDTYITRAVINEDPNFRWCRACDAGQEHLSGEDGNIFTCHACGHKICIKHENTWHEGETCEEYDYRSSGQKERDQKAQEEASLAAIGKLSKKCPGPKCVYNIEKNDGCDHMTCSKCRYEFCWVCLSEYNKIRRQGNSAHERDCKYYM